MKLRFKIDSDTDNPSTKRGLIIGIAVTITTIALSIISISAAIKAVFER